MVSRPAPASTWHLVFTRFAESVFTRDELARWLLGVARAGRARVSPESIRRDVDVFLRTYHPARADSRRPLEDSFDCPLAELGLLHAVDARRFALPRGPRPSLPLEILACALLEFWDDAAPDQQTLTLERALFDPGSPGGAFRLGDRDLVALLERMPAAHGLAYDETAGLRMLRRTRRCNPFAPLRKYYAGTRR